MFSFLLFIFLNSFCLRLLFGCLYFLFSYWKYGFLNQNIFLIWFLLFFQLNFFLRHFSFCLLFNILPWSFFGCNFLFGFFRGLLNLFSWLNFLLTFDELIRWFDNFENFFELFNTLLWPAFGWIKIFCNSSEYFRYEFVRAIFVNSFH